MLYFSNPAVHANESYQVIFPPDVDWATFHAKTDFAPWPLARGPFVGRDFAPGTDLSWWKNHPYPISFFVYRSGLDFLGGYDHGRGPASCTWPIATPCRARSSGPGATGPTGACGTGSSPTRTARTSSSWPAATPTTSPTTRGSSRASRGRRPLLVPRARPGRGQGRQPRGRAQPRREGRPGPGRREHDREPARRSRASHRSRPGRLRGDSDHRSRRAVRSRGGAARGRPRGGLASRRPRIGRDGAGGVREPPAAEDGRAEEVSAAAAARAGQDRRGALPDGRAARAVPQPPLRRRGLLPRGPATRPGRRAHEHRRRGARPATGAVRARPRSASPPRSAA